MNESATRRVVERISEAAAHSQDTETLWQSAADALSAAIPDLWDTCWHTVDPESLLITSHFRQGRAEVPESFLAELVAHESSSDDINGIVQLSRSETGIATLHEATGGNPGICPRWRRLTTVGGDQELRMILRTRSGETWGALSLYREVGRPLFGPEVHALLRAVAPSLTQGVKRTLLQSRAAHPETDDGPGLIILDREMRVQSTSPGTERWLGRLPDGDWAAGRLPSAVLSVAASVLRTTDAGGSVAEPPQARVASRGGGWLFLHGARLALAGRQQAAVIVESAQAARLHTLLMSAYGFTERERDVTRLILQGQSTRQIAGSLSVTVNTVQQHLKGIFDKTGVRSRRDLTGKVFSGR
ncbi:helix-turn-helix transcriptional regulator [Streptomyces sp. NPDC002309]